MFDLITLSLLLDGPKHGYQLKREAGFIFGHGDMHNNLIYPLLRRFTRSAWVTKKAVPGQRGQTRQQYALTPKGRRELIQQLGEYTEQDAQSQEGFVTRVGMFEVIAPETRAAILEQRAAYLRKRETRLTSVAGNLDVGTYGRAVIDLLEQQLHSELAWIERLKRRIHRPKPASRPGTRQRARKLKI
ncbi:MAG TPA: PadR family transcriptional regulator [Candidatus Sulfotelmatobacter sp.]|nr:PadR family transcriptional regulator [Candidatus Sulfotelmatobacter sp.]